LPVTVLRPAEPSTAELDVDVEVPAAAWTPMPYPADLRAPGQVVLRLARDGFGVSLTGAAVLPP
jgi:hypothetical protein